MSSWENTMLGVSTKKKNHELKQLFECFTENEIEEELCMPGNMLFDADYGCETELKSADIPGVFRIFNSICKGVSVFWVYDEGSDTTDSYDTEEYLYEARSMKCFYSSSKYCYGEGTAHGDSVYHILKEEIEKEAEKRKIAIKWDNEDEIDMWPSEENDDFYELCEKIKSKYSLEKLGTIKEEKPIELDNIKIDKELLKKVIHNAHNRGYEDLERRLALLRDL